MRLFPLFPIADGKCSCGRENCRDAGKHPRISAWQKGVENYAPQPGEGFGIPTGSVNGVFVVDLDGPEAAKHFYSLGPVPKTFTVRTGREELGVHLYFRLPPGETIRNDRGRKLGHCKIDIRGEGGFVVGPGSPHKSGRTYTILDPTAPAEAPAWLIQRVIADAQERREAAATAPKPVDLETPEGERRVKLAFTYCDEEAEPAVQGENGSGALWLVANQLVRTLELPLDAAAQIIEEVYNPRCSPAWSKKEIWHKLEDARDRGTRLPGTPSEGFMEGLRPLQHVPTPAAPSARKRKASSHTYKVKPGDVPNGEKSKISFANAVATLVGHVDWAGVLQYDEFRKRVYAVDPPIRLRAEDLHSGLGETDGGAISLWFEIGSMYLIGKDMAFNAAVQASQSNAFHPVREYLESLPKGRTGILDTLASRAFGATSPEADEFLKKTLVGAARRIRRPGCKMDTVLVLVGKQGIKKSTAIEAIFGVEYTRSQMPDLATKDASQALNGFWAVELAEMARILNSPSQTVKEFLTRKFDDYRPPYGHVDQRFPRECILIGTTNEDDFLVDATGNRRYLPVQCGDIDLAFLETHRDEIWQDAAALESSGYQHWYKDDTIADKVRAEYVQEDAWMEVIRDWLKGKQNVSGREVYECAIQRGDRDVTKLDKKTQMRIADTLKKLGCSRAAKGSDGVRRWTVEPGLAASKPTPALRVVGK